MPAFVATFDLDGDERATFAEFLKSIESPDAEFLLEVMGHDLMWWATYEAYEEFVMVKRDGNEGPITIAELSTFLALINHAGDAEKIFENYAVDADGLSNDELAEIFYDWAKNMLRGATADKFWWFDLKPTELYGGLRDDFEHHILKADLNQDGFVTVREILTALEHPELEDLVNKYGEDHMWWHDGDFYLDAFV